MNDKIFYTASNIGSAKYVINTHNGIDKHKDGSRFYGIETFSNKKKFSKKINELIASGYKESQFIA